MAKKKNNKQTGPISPEKFLKEKANKLPIYKCLMSPNYKESGEAMIVIARERGNGKLCVGNYLVDVWCLGVKEAYGNVNMEKEVFEDFAKSNEGFLNETDYDTVHNLIYGAIEFAEEADLEPDRSFNTWGNILAEDNDDVPLIEMEFGRNGKHVLVADAGSRESLLIHQLKEKLGDEFDFIIADREDDDYGYDNYDYSEPPFHYDYPEYPSELNLKHPEIADILLNEDYFERIPREEIERILALPHEDVETDLIQFINWYIGQKYPIIQDDPDYLPKDSSMMWALGLLTAIGSKKGYEAALELLRQSDDFTESTIGMECNEWLIPVLMCGGEEALPEMEKFLNEKGHAANSYPVISEAMEELSKSRPELKEKIIAILGDWLRKMPERLREGDWYTMDVPGLLVASLLDLNAKELLPDIEKVYATGLVDEGVCGSIEDVRVEMRNPNIVNNKFDYTSPERIIRLMTE